MLGTLPGMIAGAAIRAELLRGTEAFLLVLAAVLMPLGAWLAFAEPAPPRRRLPRSPPAVRLSETLLRRGLGLVALGLGLRYAVLAVA